MQRTYKLELTSEEKQLLLQALGIYYLETYNEEANKLQDKILKTESTKN
jgi:hypothetical protein